MYTRKVEKLGRVVIPSKIKKNLGISDGEEVDIKQVGNRIIISKSSNQCALCGNREELTKFGGNYVCKKCAKTIALAANL